MCTHNPRRAREWLLALLETVRPPATGCADGFAHDFSEYDATLEAVLNRREVVEERSGTFTRNKTELAQQALQRLTLAEELGPAARMVAALAADGAEALERAAAAYAAAVARLTPSHRALSEVAGSGSLEKQVAVIVEKLDAAGLSPVALLSAHRGFLARGLAAERCAAIVSPDGSVRNPHRTLRGVEFFDERLRLRLGKDTPPLTEEKSRPDIRVAKGIEYHAFWTSPKAKGFSARMRQLIQRVRREQGDAAAAREAGAGAALEFRLLLNDLGEWKPEDEASQANYFHQRAALSYGLLEVAPTEEERAAVVANLLSFLAVSRFKQESRIEWFRHVRNALLLPEWAKNVSRETIREAIRHSGDPVLLAYHDLMELGAYPPRAPGTR